MAEAVMKALIHKQNLDHALEVDSAGLGGWHRGSLPDARMRSHAGVRGYRMEHRARTVAPDDFLRFDYIFGMDEENLKHLKQLAAQQKSTSLRATVADTMDFAGNPKNLHVIPDPYYGDEKDFENVIDLCELACPMILQRIIDQKLKIH